MGSRTAIANRHKSNGQQLPPHDLTAERALLYDIAEDDDAWEGCRGVIRAVDFFGHANAIIFGVIASLRSQTAGVTWLAVAEELDRRNLLEEVGGPAGLMEIVDSTSGNTALWRYHLKLVKQASRRRQLDYLSSTLKRLAHDPTEDLDSALATAQAGLQQTIEGGATVERFRLLSAAELLEQDATVPYLVPGILSARQPCIVGAPMKSLKTTIAALDLTISLACRPREDGEPSRFLQRFPVARRCRCAVLSGESGLATLQESVRRICAKKGIDPAKDLEGWFLSDDIPRLADTSDMAKLRRLIQRLQIECLLVDPLYLAMADAADDVANSVKMGSYLLPIGQLCVELGVTPILVAHFSMGASRIRGFKPPELGDLAHAGFSQWARQWILLNRRSEYADDGRHELWMRCGGSAGHSALYGLNVSEGLLSDVGGRHWHVDVLTPTEVKDQDREGREREKADAERQQEWSNLRKMRAAMEETPHGDSLSAIAERAKLNPKNGRATMNVLLEAKEAEECHVEKGGKRYAGYRLTTP